MTSTEEIPINGRPLTEDELQEDRERGTSYDWVAWPPDTSLDGNIATEYPDRGLIAELNELPERDGQAAAVLLALTMPIRMANNTIEQPEGDEEGKITDFVTQALTAPYWEGGMQTSLPNLIGQMARARLTKRAFFEKVFTRNKDGKAVYKKIAWRPPASCLLMRDRRTGDMRGYKQWQDLEKAPNLDDEGYAVIQPQYALVYIHGQHIDPLFGSSDLQVARWCAEMKQKVWTLWMRYADRQAIPKTAAFGKDKTQADRNAKAFAGLGSAGVVGIERNDPTEKVFEVLDNSGGGSAHQVFMDLMKYLDGMMSRAVMASWLDLPSAAGSGAGSYALSADQSGMFMQGQFAVMKEIADLMTGEVIAPLVRLNFGPDAPIPRFKFEKIDSEQTATIMALVQQISATEGGPQMPQGIFDILIERVGQYLDLDDTKVRKVLRDAEKERQEAKKAEEEAAALAAAGPPADPNAPVDPNAPPAPAGPGAPPAAPLSPDMQKLQGLVDGALKATEPAPAGV